MVRSVILNDEFESWVDYVKNQGWRNAPLPSEGKIPSLANDKNQTWALLSKDKKFMASVRKMKDEIMDGFKSLINERKK